MPRPKTRRCRPRRKPPDHNEPPIGDVGRHPVRSTSARKIEVGLAAAAEAERSSTDATALARRAEVLGGTTLADLGGADAGAMARSDQRHPESGRDDVQITTSSSTSSNQCVGMRLTISPSDFVLFAVARASKMAGAMSAQVTATAARPRSGSVAPADGRSRLRRRSSVVRSSRFLPRRRAGADEAEIVFSAIR